MIDGFQGVADILEETGHEVHSFEELKEWLESRKESQKVSISRVALDDCIPWFYDKDAGQIRNPLWSFFQIAGIKCSYPDEKTLEQPIILQNEIGFLGIICKKFNGIWHFLMQAKIEPGNINYVQISPTIQATKSNFSRLHGGREPAYLRWFIQMSPENVLADQIQSEQSSRFLGKRNRNVILKTEKEIEETDAFRWMTLYQLKRFMAIDNCVNMDTRTVLSCIPYVFLEGPLTGYTKEFTDSIGTIDRKAIRDLYILANDYKMFKAGKISFLPLTQLREWDMRANELVHRDQYPFKVIYCNLEIEGREVTKWNQPLVEALGDAMFGLVCSKSSGILEILVKLKPEIGCHDVVEVGPTIQEEYGSKEKRDEVTSLFFARLTQRKDILIDVVLSEEGGRFYHEQNRNVVMMMNKTDVRFDPSQYVWATVGTLNAMTQINNCLNIQLRNLLTLLYMYN